MAVVLRMTEAQHARLRDHLFPGDGLEAIAFALCGRRAGDERHVLSVRKLLPIPYDQCSAREPDYVTWSTASLVPFLLEASQRGLGVVKIHSHPKGYPRFSERDDDSDRNVFSSVHGWMDDDHPHASVVMLPNGQMFGREIQADGTFEPLELISVVGDNLRFWYPGEQEEQLPEFTRRHAQIFGKGTTARLRRLSVAVVGCSGTGSPLVEQLARLGVGRLVLIDPDVVEEKNLNRILNATMEDAKTGRPKIEVLARSVRAMGLGTVVVPLKRNLIDREVLELVAGCDLVFGCMDGVEGRDVLNRLATFYLLPYFDLGVRLQAGEDGEIEYVGGTVRYVQPGRSSLLSRGVYDLEQVHAESLRRTDPAAYAEQKKAGYLRGVDEDRPAVISVNMMIAALAVNELLARLHPFRLDDNGDFADHRISISHAAIDKRPEGKACALLMRYTGRGDMTPFLDRPTFDSGSS